MKPILYQPTETAFDTNGIGILSDAVDCVVTEERNGAFELEMIYPISGMHFSEITLRCVILAKPNPTDEAQPFRIYNISKPHDGRITIYAEHISYDLSGIPVSPFSAASAPAAMTGLKSNAAISNPFTFWTDKTTAASFAVNVPSSTRAIFGGSRGSILDVYGGEFKYDRFLVRLYNERGENRGVSIRYGKNLISLKQEKNCSNVYTGIYPYWVDADGNLIELSEKIVNAEGTYGFTRIMPLDFSLEFDEAPTEQQLKNKTDAYIKNNNIGVPKVNIDVSFVPLEQTEEYKHLALLERVSLCDIVNVEFPELKVSATAKCVKTVYDVLLDRYRSIELGDAKTNIADTIVQQLQDIKEKPTKTYLQQAVENATALITGNKGGYVVLHSTTGAEPDEILVMNTPSIENATKVWRFNTSGLGYSAAGYNGPYGLAMTMDGAIVADFITTGTLNAALIKAGVLQSNDGKTFYLDLEKGVLRMQAEEIYISGKTVEQIADDSSSKAIKGLTQTDVFNKLTNNGALQGLYMQNNQLYVNASYINTGELNADLLKAGSIKSKNYSFIVDGQADDFCDSGMLINLTDGSIFTPNLSIYSNGNAVFRGDLQAAKGTFAGELSAVYGTFTHLIGKDYIQLNTLTVRDDGITYSNGNNRFDLWMNDDTTCNFTSNKNMFLGGYDGGTVFETTIYGSTLHFTSSMTGYNMRLGIPPTATNEASLYPATPGTCNIGTNSYYFDYVHANTVTQHSLKKDKTDIEDLADSDYDIDSIRPISYRVKGKENAEFQIGLIAEELERCCYKACTHDEKGQLYGIDYSRLAVVAIREIQKLRNRLSSMEGKVYGKS